MVDVEPTQTDTGDGQPMPGFEGRAPTRHHQDALGRGSSVGRYLVLELLGQGGMGAVYAAYDPELDRRIALKLLLPRTRASSTAGPRLLREAQALARLSHPNVVTVHDAGMDGDHLFIAMELVRGATLRAWMEEEPRPWRTVLEVLIQAGRGLQAAHREGIVHRDFKPENVLVGDGGRVRVMDFGLARSEAEVETGTDPEGTPVEPYRLPDGSLPLSARLTRAGTVLGTPAYMSPEQHRGDVTDARTDQFSFCVAAYEALYGRRPFRGETIEALCVRVLAGTIEEPPREARVPAWLRRILVRGLAVEPDDRFRDMGELLDALERGATGRTRTMLLTAAIPVLAAVVSWAVLRDDGPQPCEGAAERLAETWSDERWEEIAEAFDATGLGYASETAARVGARVDTYAERWIAAHTEACEATHVRGEQSSALLDLRMICLDRRRRELAALVDVLSRADPEIVESSVAAVSGLPGVEPCADLDYVRATVPPPPDERTARNVDRMDERLAEARALGRAGKYAEARKSAEAAASESERVDYPPLWARANLVLGEARFDTNDFEEATSAQERAFFLAQEHEVDDVARDAAIGLVRTVGWRRAEHERGHEWAEHARVAVARSHDERARASLLAARSHVLQSEGKGAEAVELLREALEIHQRQGEVESPRVASLLTNLGVALYRLERYAEAQEQHQRALAIRREHLGPEHPEIAGSLNNLANTHMARGDLDTALALQSEALQVLERGVGLDDLRAANTYNNIGAIEYQQRHLERALASFGHALRIRERVLPADHPDIAASVSNVGAMLQLLDRTEEALPMLERALQIRTARLGPEHVAVARTLSTLGLAHGELGNHEQARAHMLRAIELAEKTHGRRSVAVATYVGNLGVLELGRQRHAEALPSLLEALELSEQLDGLEHSATARARLNVALAYEGLSRDADADAQYRQARDVLRVTVGADSPLLAYALVGLGKTRRRLGDPRGALEAAEAGLAIREAASDVARDELAEARFTVALALDALGTERERAEALARQARDGYDASRLADERAAVDQWLRGRGAG